MKHIKNQYHKRYQNSTFTYRLSPAGVRSGKLRTRAGVISTPTFMPDATRGAVKGLTPQQIADTGVQAILSNTYHLHLQPGEKTIAALGGIHSFSGWQGPILTDSGGFQVFSLAKIRKISEEGVTFRDPVSGKEIFLSPEKSIQIQLALGSDMLVAFDDVTALDDAGKSRTREAFERTHRWLERSLTEFQRLTASMGDKERPLIFGVVQGGLSKTLRKKSLDLVQALPVDGIAIGGLSVGEPRADMHAMLEYLAPYYDLRRPHFLLGVGHPVDMRFALKHAIDMFDCVLPTRNARHGTAWIKGDKTIHLTNAIFAKDDSVLDSGCDCYTCHAGYSRGFLRHQFKVGENLAGTLVSIHNLRYLQRICEAVVDPRGLKP